PGPSFRAACKSNVREIIFKIKSGNGCPSRVPQGPVAGPVNGAVGPGNGAPGPINSMASGNIEFEYEDKTMTKLVDLGSYLQKQQSKKGRSDSDGSESNIDSEGIDTKDEDMG
ncbi:hypothetical protein BG005_005712, partial [Podila minutissima]